MTSIVASEGSATLRDQLAERRLEAQKLRAQLQNARLESQQLRLRLKAAGIFDATLAPGRIQAGSGAPESNQLEIQSLIQWLVDTVDLTHQIVFECGNGEGEVVVGGKCVLLQRMAMWKLNAEPESKLKLSVPWELQAEIHALLSDSRLRGRIDPVAMQKLSEAWEILGAEVVSAAAGRSDPAIFLVHKTTNQAVVVAQWPAVEFQQVAPPCFDPVQHFGRLTADIKALQISGASKVAQVQTAPTSDADGRQNISMGSRVEVEYQGQWFAGVLQWVDGDIANVKCDVDSPGVITVAPLTNVRLAKTAMQKFPCHFRARSIG